jgi:hypothetical protein
VPQALPSVPGLIAGLLTVQHVAPVVTVGCRRTRAFLGLCWSATVTACARLQGSGGLWRGCSAAPGWCTTTACGCGKNAMRLVRRSATARCSGVSLPWRSRSRNGSGSRRCRLWRWCRHVTTPAAPTGTGSILSPATARATRSAARYSVANTLRRRPRRVRARPHPARQIRPRRRLGPAATPAGRKSRALRARVLPGWPVCAHVPDLLGVWRQRWPQAAERAVLDVHCLWGGARPGRQRRAQHPRRRAAERLNACGGDVRPSPAVAVSSEAGTHRGAA